MKQNKHLIIVTFLYLILAFITSNFLIHGVDPDTVSYFSISKKYYDGNFSEAVNAYWGPLLSWIILPSYLIKVEPHIFARILFVIFSIILFVVIDKFFIRLKLNDQTRSIGIYFFILPAVLFTFYRLTPDYLQLILSLFYIYTISEENYWENKKIVLLSSLIGALMFFAKSYSLTFFLSFQTILMLIEFIKNKKFDYKILLSYILSIIIFLILISPWIYLLSNKYGSFTISSSGSINIRIINPELNFRHPPIESGFTAPVDKFSISAWDDPNINAYPEWHPFSSLGNFKYFLSNTVKNIFKLIIFILAFSPILSLLIFFLKKKDLQNSILIKLFFAGSIYGLGYTMIYVENRYIWTTFIIFALIGISVLNSYYQKLFRNKTQRLLISLIIIFSFLPFFSYGINQNLHTAYAYHQANSIKNKFGISGKFASTNYWGHSLALSYFLNSKYYGTEKLPINTDKFLENAKKNGINYIFDYSELKEDINGLEFIGKIDSIKIYKITDN